VVMEGSVEYSLPAHRDCGRYGGNGLSCGQLKPCVNTASCLAGRFRVSFNLALGGQCNSEFKSTVSRCHWRIFRILARAQL
jgi:hypothetical protein